MNQTYDAIIVGAGVMGASIACNLSQRGLKVLILERQSVAVGATGASSGLVRMHYDIEVDSALAWQSFHFFRNWRERIGGECGFHKTGFLQIVAPEKNEQLRGMPRCRCDSCGAAFKRCDALFQHGRRRIGNTCINIAERLQPEQGGRMIRIFEHEGRRLIDWHSPGSRCRIHFLPGMDRQRVKLVLFLLTHFSFLLKICKNKKLPRYGGASLPYNILPYLPGSLLQELAPHLP